MKLINRLTDDAHQTMNIVGEENEIISFNLYFMPTQKAWFCDIIWNTFEVTGLQVVFTANMLHTWSSILPFGICCWTIDGYDPAYINDFLTGRAQLYILSTSDVASLEVGVF